MTLLERDHLLAELSPLLEEAADGAGAVVALVGEAGVGKTSLLNELARRNGEKLRILTTGCEALFTPRPLGPLYDIAANLGIDVEVSRDRLFPSVLAAVSCAPTLFVVEDVHWADRATLDLLKYLARRITRSSVLLAISYRDDEVGADHPLVILLGEVVLHRVRLERLSRGAIETLVREQPCSTSPADAEAIFMLTGGNPFYVTEVLASAADGVPATVRDAVLARAAGLSPAARRVIEIASLMPGRAELAIIEASDDDLEAAVRSGIVHIADGAIVFRHELGRRAIEDSLSDVRRVTMHRGILEKLAGERSLARLAHHASGARDPVAILRYAPLAAAEAAKAGAHREAAAHYRAALASSEALDVAEAARLLESLAYECYLTDRLEEALTSQSAAVEIWKAVGDRTREGDNLRFQSRLLWFLGRNAEARARAREAIDVLEPLGEGSELAMAYSNQSQLYMLAEENEEAILLGTRAIEMATRLHDDGILAHALNNVGSAEKQIGRSSDKLERSLAIALEHGLQEHVARAYVNLIGRMQKDVDYEAARRYIDEGIAWCRARDLDSWFPYMMTWSARLHLEIGEWGPAAEIAQTVLAQYGSGSAVTRMAALTVLGRVNARRGDPDADLLLDEARTLAMRTTEFQRIGPVACARAERAWLRGDAPRAAEEAADAFAMANNMNEGWTRGDLALWMWRGGVIDSPPANIAEPYAFQIAGQWREAAAAFEKVRRPYESAVALGDGDDVEELQRAMAILETLGDGCLGDRLRQKLRALGVRGPRQSTQTNPAGLTAREVDVLHLIDEGLRNADIAKRLSVSAKTVDHHVSSILSKLEAKTRGEAARKFKSLI